MWGAGFLCEVLALDVCECVFLQRNSRKAALLRAVVDQAIFADIEVARTGAAMPVVRSTLRQILLEPIKAAITVFAVGFDFAINTFLAAIQRLHRAVPVMDYSE